MKTISCSAWIVLILSFLAALGCSGSSSGKFVYVVGQNTNSVFAFQQSSGALAALSTASFGTGSAPSAVVVHPSKKLALVANLGSANLSVFTMDPNTGLLTASGTPVSTGGIGPVALALDPSGQFLYVLNQASNDIAVFSVDASTGNLLQVPGSPFPTQPNAQGLSLGTTLLYVANGSQGTVSGFLTGAGGSLAAVPNSPFAAGVNISSVAVDPLGRFVYATDSRSNTVVGFTIQSGTGTLFPIPGSPFPAGTGPSSITIDSTGKLGVRRQ